MFISHRWLRVDRWNLRNELNESLDCIIQNELKQKWFHGNAILCFSTAHCMSNALHMDLDYIPSTSVVVGRRETKVRSFISILSEKFRINFSNLLLLIKHITNKFRVEKNCETSASVRFSLPETSSLKVGHLYSGFEPKLKWLSQRARERERERKFMPFDDDTWSVSSLFDGNWLSFLWNERTEMKCTSVAMTMLR